MDEERLARIALELACRVRHDDPDDNGDWLLAETTEQERWQLLFTLAATTPATLNAFRRAKAWAAKAEPPPAEFVDDIAVERACRGEPVPLNRLEQAAAVKRLTKRGWSIKAIAGQLGTYRRFVQRVRSGEVAWARDVA